MFNLLVFLTGTGLFILGCGFTFIEALPALYRNFSVRLRYKNTPVSRFDGLRGCGLNHLLNRKEVALYVLSIIAFLIYCFYIYVQFELSLLEIHIRYCL